MKKTIAQVVIGLPVEGPFDYAVPAVLQNDIHIGQRVKVFFNRSIQTGYVVGFLEKSTFPKLNTIIAALENVPSINSNAVKLTQTFSKYYGCSWGEAMETYLPAYLRKPMSVVFKNSDKEGQQERQAKTTLLQNLDDKKSWDYLKNRIHETLKEKRSVVILVPELSMIDHVLPHLSGFSALLFNFGKKLTAKEEFEQWKDVRESDFCIVIGARSTVFAPAPDLGLMIVLDEESMSYKQDQSPFYHVDKVVQMRQDLEHCDAIFASCAPTVETWFQAQDRKWEKISFIPEQLSQIKPVDLSNYAPQTSGYLAVPLKNRLDEVLKEGKRALLFMNRRGASTFTSCNQCGHVLKCERCDINFVFSNAKQKLVCTRCNAQTELPSICPQCKGGYLRSVGSGVEKLKTSLSKLYPHVWISFCDKETDVIPPNTQILISTQAVLKFQHTLDVDLVGVLDFDQEINRSDFASIQKIFSVLVHLRCLAKKEMFVQTFLIDHYALQSLKNLDFERFYAEELSFRKQLNLPPYRSLVEIRLRGAAEDKVLGESQRLLKSLEEDKRDDIELSHVHSDTVAKLRDKFRFTIALRGTSTEMMVDFIKSHFKKFKLKSGIILMINVGL
jgi:primosomal protein N' (replication factor Y)